MQFTHFLCLHLIFLLFFVIFNFDAGVVILLLLSPNDTDTVPVSGGFILQIDSINLLKEETKMGEIWRQRWKEMKFDRQSQPQPQSNLINPINNGNAGFRYIVYIYWFLFCSINFHTIAREFDVQIIRALWQTGKNKLTKKNRYILLPRKLIIILYVDLVAKYSFDFPVSIGKFAALDVREERYTNWVKCVK